MIRLTRPAIAGLFLIAGLAACGGSKDEYAAGSIDTMKPVIGDSTTPAAPVMSHDWSSPAVIGFAVIANDGEITLGKLARTKATHADVKAFARLMTADHSAMMSDTKKLAATINVLADTAADEARDLATDARDELKELTDKAAGADWDKDYMDEMIEAHEEVLEKLNEAAKSNKDAEVQKTIGAAVAKVQLHLAKAREIRAKLE